MLLHILALVVGTFLLVLLRVEWYMFDAGWLGGYSDVWERSASFGDLWALGSLDSHVRNLYFQFDR